MGRCPHIQHADQIWRNALQMKQFLDIQGGLWAQGKLANKVVSAMSSASNPHGGQEKPYIALYSYDALGDNNRTTGLYG